MVIKNIFFTKNSFFRSNKKIKNRTYKELHKFIEGIKKNKYPLLSSYNPEFKLDFQKKKISNLKNKKNFLIIGMGGSILGAKAIYSFLKKKIKKNFLFLDNLNENIKKFLSKNNNKVCIFISKSGNTLETLVNYNIIIKKNNHKNNLFITENKSNLFREIANKLKNDVIEHKNYIGGRFSVMSEVGMLPAQLMGLKVKKFKNLNRLIENKKFQIKLIQNASTIYSLYLKNKTNSVILNYDPEMEDLCYWYQQLVAESLGKKNNGIFPIISSVPKDNHSLFQLFLDGKKNNFFTIFFSRHDKEYKLDKSYLPSGLKYLSKKTLESVANAQRLGTQEALSKKRIPFRTFYVLKKNEVELGYFFTYFVLETILLSRLMKINPFDQPAVEIIKQKTKKFII